jgi:L-threonylcarbamoyladenylate synthase
MPVITIISSPKDLELFDISTTDFEKEQIAKFWPGANTLIFKLPSGVTRSFRLPDNEFLISILKETGPLISTSANLHNQPFAKTIEEAISNFGDVVDFYVDGGTLDNPPSHVYNLTNGVVEQIR